jgi:hypothetical protein
MRRSAPVVEIDLLPPFDADSESGALACVLSAADGEAERLLDQLTLDYFYDQRHREIYNWLKSLRAEGKALNVITLAKRIKSTGKIDNEALDSLLAYVHGLPDATPSPANFPTYLEILQESTRRRAIVNDTAEVQAMARDTSVSVDVLADAARRLGQSYGVAGSLTQVLGERVINAHTAPPPLRTIYSLAGVCISTPGNLTTITSALKTGKSAVIGAMKAAAMQHKQGADLLDFSSSNPKNLAVLSFDSEQSPNDAWSGHHLSVRRAGLKEAPDWLHAFCLTGLGHKLAWDCVVLAVQSAADRHGGVHSILLDGAADFVADVNDAEESNAFVAALHGMAIQFDCSVVCVIHFNPGSEKSRGHLGSQLERKAETNLILEKDQEEITTIYSTKNRRAGIAKSTGPRFKFSCDDGMHISLKVGDSQAEKEQSERLIMLAEDLFRERPAMAYTDLVSTAKTLLKISDRTAARRVSELSRQGAIKKSVSGLWTKTT